MLTEKDKEILWQLIAAKSPEQILEYRAKVIADEGLLRSEINAFRQREKENLTSQKETLQATLDIINDKLSTLTEEK